MSELDTISNGLEVSQYTYDTTKPELDSFYMDMDAGTLTLTFSETVDVSKVGRFAQKWVGLRGFVFGCLQFTSLPHLRSKYCPSWM